MIGLNSHFKTGYENPGNRSKLSFSEIEITSGYEPIRRTYQGLVASPFGQRVQAETERLANVVVLDSGFPRVQSGILGTTSEILPPVTTFNIYGKIITEERVEGDVYERGPLIMRGSDHSHDQQGAEATFYDMSTHYIPYI